MRSDGGKSFARWHRILPNAHSIVSHLGSLPPAFLVHFSLTARPLRPPAGLRRPSPHPTTPDHEQAWRRRRASEEKGQRDTGYWRGLAYFTECPAIRPLYTAYCMMYARAVPPRRGSVCSPRVHAREGQTDRRRRR